MKRSLFTILLLIALFPICANAQLVDRSVLLSFSPGAGRIVNEASSNRLTARGWNVSAERVFANRRVSLGVMLGNYKTSNDEFVSDEGLTSQNIESFAFHLRGKYLFEVGDGVFVPFAMLGLGVVNSRRATTLIPSAQTPDRTTYEYWVERGGSFSIAPGLGFKVFLGNVVFLGLDAQGVWADRTYTKNNFNVFGSLSIGFQIY